MRTFPRVKGTRLADFFSVLAEDGVVDIQGGGGALRGFKFDVSDRAIPTIQREGPQRRTRRERH
jgi:hypothetical protein